jgi:hypothetical protein
MDIPAHLEASAMHVTAHALAARATEPLAVCLSAAILAVRGDEPVVAVVPARRGELGSDGALPCGTFSPRQHGTLEAGVRFWVQQQAGIELGTLRQIGTLDDCHAAAAGTQPSGLPVVAVCYQALVGPARFNERSGTLWRSWYAYFPWEDWRRGKPACLTSVIEPRLEAWATLPAHRQVNQRGALDRRQRLSLAFGWDGAGWDEENVRERFDLLCEAGLLGDTVEVANNDASAVRPEWLPPLRHPLLGDQGRLLADAIGELRRDVKCRPVIFELMPEVFTLFELQKTVEAILGPHLHKQNFRRLVEGGGLVEPTSEYRQRTGGRPARLYRFRRDVLLERLAPGVRVKAGRA